MITTLSEDELVRLGARHPAQSLIQQAGYTFGIAHTDAAALEPLFVGGYLEELEAVRAEVDAARKDKALLAAESKEATRGQNDALRRAKIWRRKVVKRALRAQRQGVKVPEGLTHITRAGSVAKVLQQVSTMEKLLSENLAAINAATGSADALVEDGKTIYKALGDADSAQEQKRLSDLPHAVRVFFAAKGKLYTGIKVVNDAGAELHADRPELASQYDLRILYRHTPTRPGTP